MLTLAASLSMRKRQSRRAPHLPVWETRDHELLSKGSVGTQGAWVKNWHRSTLATGGHQMALWSLGSESPEMTAPGGGNEKKQKGTRTQKDGEEQLPRPPALPLAPGVVYSIFLP